ncbi:MAG TPA: hypothetical protein VFG20_03715 [Planctomycetaceae bacterium]|nr:hypothetical protein [Planctomycetaceae bacterium]
MLAASWLWNWLEQRPRTSAPADPLAEFVRLSVERLEDRRVLSATLISGVNPNVVVDITGNDTVSVSVDNANHLVISDTDGNTADIVVALSDIDSLTFQGDGGNQSVVFAGSNSIDLAALNITSGIETVSFQQDVIADEGGVSIQALQDVTFATGADLLCSGGDVSITANGDLVMDAGSSITADDPANTWSVFLTAGDDLVTASVHAGLGVNLSAGASTLDTASLQVTGAITSDRGAVSITSADDISFTADGDVTVGNGSLIVTAGIDAGDTLTMADGTVFSVNHTATTFAELSAGGDVHLGEISGVNLDRVTVQSLSGAIVDNTAAETANITAAAVALRGFTGIGSVTGDADIDLAVNQLAFFCGNGAVALTNNGALTITAVDGIATSLSADGGMVSATGPLLIAMDVQLGGTFNFTTAGQFTLGGAGADILAAGANVTIHATGGVQEGNGSTIAAAELLLTGTGTFQLQQQNEIGVLAANINGSLNFTEADDLVIDTVNGVQGITTGLNHDVVLQIGGGITVNDAITTTGGTGGVITVRGGVLNAALIAGGGDITILSNGPDLIINAAQTSATTLNLSAPRDVIINAVVTTTGTTADVLITGDADNNGTGGVRVTAAGQVVSGRNIILIGSDLFATAGASDGIRIDADGVNDQLRAAGDITLQAAVNSPISAAIVIDGRVHSTGGDIVVDARNAIRAQSAIIADNGDVTFRDALVLTGALQVTAGGRAEFLQTINDDGVGGTVSDLTVTATGVTNFVGAVGNRAALSSVTTNGTGPVEVRGGLIRTTGTQSFATGVVLFSNTAFVSTAAAATGADLTFQSTIATNGNNLTIDAGTQGDLTVTAALTGGGTVLVQRGDVVNFAAINVDAITIQAATTSVTFHNSVLITNSASVTSSGTVTLQNTFTVGQNLNVNAMGAISAQAALTAGNQLTLHAGTTLTLPEAADLIAGAGGVDLSGTQIISAAEITTNNGPVSLTGAVILTGDVTIDTGTGGSVLITGSVNAQTAMAPTLFLSTGTGDITVRGDIGTTSALQAVEISDARNVTISGGISAGHLLQQSGLGTTTITGAVNTFDAQGIQLKTTSLQFAGGSSSMDSHGHNIMLMADAITLPTTFTRALGATVTLQTLTATTTIGLEDSSQDLNFTDVQLDMIQAQHLVIGAATQTGGIHVGTDGPVSLAVNLGLQTGGSISVFGPLSLAGNNSLQLLARDDIHINGSVSTAAGSQQIHANDDITIGATGQLTSVSGNLLVRADANGDLDGSGGGITMADGVLISAGTGTITLEADESVVLGQVATNNATANAIAVTSHHGGIVDGGDSRGPNLIANAATAVVTLQAQTGVGSQTGSAVDAALETQVSQLFIQNNTAGQVGIKEVDALVVRGILQQGSGQVTVTAGGTLIVALGGPGVQSHGGEISLSTTGMLSDLVLQAAITSRGGDIRLDAGGTVMQTAAAPVTTANGDLVVNAGNAISMQDGALADAGNGTIAMQAGGDVVLGQVRTTNNTVDAVSIRSIRGGIIDGGDLLGPNMIANGNGAVVTLEAALGIGSAGPHAALETQVSQLDVRNTIAGGIAIDDADALQIRSVTQLGSGDVTVRALGDLTVLAGHPGVSATTGVVTLAALTPASRIVLQSTVQTTAGAIRLLSAGDIVMSAAARVLSQTGEVTVRADADLTLGGNGGAITMADGALVNAGTGRINLFADGDITLARVITTTLVSLTTTSGGIVDGGDSGGANIVAHDLVIRAVTGVGSSNPLETAVQQIAIQNAASGAIRLDNNVPGVFAIGTVDGVTGITNLGGNAAAIGVVNRGAMTVNGAVRNLTGGDISLQANDAGPISEDLTINAVIQTLNGDGNLELQAAGDLLINDSGEDVDLQVVNSGKIVGRADGDVVIGSDVVIQSATGVITDVNPVLVNVLTPQITALGIGTITMTVQRPFEVGTVIVIDWGDGTKETFVVTEANQLTLVFEHRYFGPPDPAEPAKDIPLQITVLAPGFTAGAMPSQTPGTQLVETGSYVPNIQFFAHGQAVTPTSFGPLNETVLNTVFKTPGEGLASFAFDLTPHVEYLTFPEAAKVDTSLLAVPQPPAQINTVDAVAVRGDDTLVDARVVLLEVFTPDGQLQEQVVLAEDVLDDLDGVVKRLPDGHYRFLLREAGESQTRLLQEFDVRQGRISTGNDQSGDRPPSMMLKPLPPVMHPVMPAGDAVPPADALQPENVPTDTSAAQVPQPTWSKGARLLRKQMALQSV